MAASLSEEELYERRYRLGPVLGRGPLGIVFRAVDLQTGRPCAVKRLRTPQPDSAVLSAVQRDAAAAWALRHPVLLGAHTTDVDRDGRLYLVSDLVEGDSLKTQLRTAPLSVAQLLLVMEPLCVALEVAHGEGLAHGALKPANILTTIAGEVFLTDFGIAQIALRGAFSETLCYLPPEVYRDEVSGPAPAGDIFALGAVLFECLTGQQLFAASTSAAAAFKICQAPLPALSSVSVLTPALYEVVAMACARSVDERFAGPRSFLRALAATAKPLVGPARMTALEHVAPVLLELGARDQSGPAVKPALQPALPALPQAPPETAAERPPLPPPEVLPAAKPAAPPEIPIEQRSTQLVPITDLGLDEPVDTERADTKPIIPLPEQSPAPAASAATQPPIVEPPPAAPTARVLSPPLPAKLPAPQPPAARVLSPPPVAAPSQPAGMQSSPAMSPKPHVTAAPSPPRGLPELAPSSVARVLLQPPEQPYTRLMVNLPKKNRSRWLLLIGAVVLLCIGGGVAGVMRRQHSRGGRPGDVRPPATQQAQKQATPEQKIGTSPAGAAPGAPAPPDAARQADTYAGFLHAAERGDAEAAVMVYLSLPEGSVYRAQGQFLFDTQRRHFEQKHLQLATSALTGRLCDVIAHEVEVLRKVAPRDADNGETAAGHEREARSAAVIEGQRLLRRCRPPKHRRPPRDPGEGADSDAPSPVF